MLYISGFSTSGAEGRGYPSDPFFNEICLSFLNGLTFLKDARFFKNAFFLSHVIIFLKKYYSSSHIPS